MVFPFIFAIIGSPAGTPAGLSAVSFRFLRTENDFKSSKNDEIVFINNQKG